MTSRTLTRPPIGMSKFIYDRKVDDVEVGVGNVDDEYVPLLSIQYLTASIS